MQTQSLGGYAFPVLEYMDSIRESRTGVTRYNQGMDAESLNKTASGMNMLLGRSQKRMLMIARVFAQTGFKHAFKKTLKLVINHQDREKMIRLRNEWVPMDPRSWNAGMDVKVNVGLGHGTKEQQAGAGQLILSIQERILAGGGGMIVKPENIYNSARKLVDTVGLPLPQLYFTEPQEQQQEPPPNPEVIKVQMEAQLKEKEMQITQRRHEEQQQQEQARKDKALVLEHERGMYEIQLDAQRKGVETGKGIERKDAEASANIALKQLTTENNEESESNVIEGNFGGKVADATDALVQIAGQLAMAVTAPKRVVRDEGGKVIGIEPVT